MIIANVAVPMYHHALAILLILLSLWLYPAKKSAGSYAGISSFVSPIVTLLITLIVHVRIDNEINTWTSANSPGDFEGSRIKWKTFHALRTFTSLIRLLLILCLFMPVMTKQIDFVGLEEHLKQNLREEAKWDIPAQEFEKL